MRSAQFGTMNDLDAIVNPACAPNSQIAWVVWDDRQRSISQYPKLRLPTHSSPPAPTPGASRASWAAGTIPNSASISIQFSQPSRGT